MSQTCICNAYSWPHRKGGGKCIWNADREGPVCRACARPCEIVCRALEPEERSHGQRATSITSKCCDDEVIEEGEILTSEDLD